MFDKNEEKKIDDLWFQRDLWFKSSADEYSYKEGCKDGYNKAKEEIRKELLELKADSFDAGMFLRVGETLRNLGIKETEEK